MCYVAVRKYAAAAKGGGRRLRSGFRLGASSHTANRTGA